MASALGLGALERKAAAAEAPAAPIGPATLTLHGRRRPMPPRGALNGKANAGRMMRYGDLLDGPDGSPVGHFHANGFCLETALGLPAPSVSSVEFQTFQLTDGTLFGVGSPGGAGSERTGAVLGGTGRFAGARGTYVERDLSVAPVGRGAVEFILTLTA